MRFTVSKCCYKFWKLKVFIAIAYCLRRFIPHAPVIMLALLGGSKLHHLKCRCQIHLEIGSWSVQYCGTSKPHHRTGPYTQKFRSRIVGEVSEMMAQRSVHRTGHVPGQYPEIWCFSLTDIYLRAAKNLGRFGVYSLKSLLAALSLCAYILSDRN